MGTTDLIVLSPLIVIAATTLTVMLAIAFSRNHGISVALTLAGLALALVMVPVVSSLAPRQITPLIIIDHYALFYMGLIFAASLPVTMLSYGYLKRHEGNHEEFYVLLLLSVLGSATLVASDHFASLFLGLETLSISLYALFAYLRNDERSIEAGLKYLILAAVSAAFLLFGMALIYAEFGTMEFGRIASLFAAISVHSPLSIAGFAMIVIGAGFKLAVVPFHLWTPDVYEGAPAPVTAFVATVSKGSMFALLLRYFTRVDIYAFHSLLLLFTVIAISSMFVGNLLALFQSNIKRILAYSSIAHMGYLLVAFLAGGTAAVTAVTFYLVAYVVTTLAVFGIITVSSGRERDADRMEDYQGLARRRPWLAGIFTLMLFSLAGIPLTAGFVGKFYIMAAGVRSLLWLPVIALAVNSAIGLFYYLRIVIILYQHPSERGPGKSYALSASLPFGGTLVLAALTFLLVWLGVYPGPLIEIIEESVTRII